jgi:hypothetical protein
MMEAAEESKRLGLPADIEYDNILNVFTFSCNIWKEIADVPSGGTKS